MPHEDPHSIQKVVPVLCARHVRVSSTQKGQKSEEELTKGTPVISLDHMGPKSKGGKTEKLDSLPIICGVDRQPGWAIARAVPKNGVDSHAVKIVNRETRLAGYSGIIFNSDQEPSILAPFEAVKRERAEASDLLAEEPLVGEHPKGEAENIIRSVQSRLRTMRLGLQGRCQSKITADHSIMPWRVYHAATVIAIVNVGAGGCAPYEDCKGRKFNRPSPRNGECIW